jgi:hypothetical protein
MKHLKTYEEKQEYDLPNETDKKYWTLLDKDYKPVAVFELEEIIKEIKNGIERITYMFEGLTIDKSNKFKGGSFDINQLIIADIEKKTFEKKKKDKRFRLANEEEINTYNMLRNSAKYNI